MATELYLLQATVRTEFHSEVNLIAAGRIITVNTHRGVGELPKISRSSRMIENHFLIELFEFRAHGLLRWAVLAAAVAAILVAFSGWSGTKPAEKNLRLASVIFVIAMDFELLIGLLLFFGASPITRAALANLGEAMKNHESRFFTIEHTVLMLLAVTCAHVGGALSRKGRTDLAKYRGAAIAYLISLLLMLGGIPWWRPLLRLGS